MRRAQAIFFKRSQAGCLQRSQASFLQRSQAGFTLLEVLVAIVLMALVSLLSWRGLDQITRASDRLNAATDQTQAIVRVLGQLGQDLDRQAPATVLEAGSVQDRKPPFEILPPALHIAQPEGGAMQLEIVRSVPAQPGAWQRVRWWREGDTLRRAASAPAQDYPLPEPDAGAVVLDAVSRFEIRAWIPASGWAQLPMEPGSTAATGLEIIIERQDRGVPEHFRQVVVLP